MRAENREEYLETIYGLLEDGKEPKTGEIARKLNLKSASVTEMLKKLDKEGYIKYRPYYGVELTKKGLKIASKIKRKHRLLERFLTDVLRMRKGSVHDQACRMEHGLSDEAADALDKLMNHPQECPDDGKPIPPAGEAKILNTLLQLRPGGTAKVAELSGGMSFQTRMRALGLMEGKKIKVIAVEPLGGPVVVKTGNTRVTIGRGMAEKIKVIKV